MNITSIILTNYKNYESQRLDFQSNLVAILGNNGMGKTNVLDAIYYSCIGKSYFTSSDRNVIKHDSDFFRLESEFYADDKHRVIVKVKPSKLKKIEVDNNPLDKISDLIGNFPVVIVAPVDIQLLLEGSEERRLFMNNSIIQYSKEFLHSILLYNRLLKQRNALLKMFSEKRYFDPALLESISVKMVEPSKVIYKHRKEFIEKIRPIFESIYTFISKGQEVCLLAYKSHLEDNDLKDIFAKNLEKDRVLGRTSAGVHKDDLDFIMSGDKLKTFASQGQLKTYILALKLAQYAILKSQLNTTPILLLDDLFDKLDEHRVTFLLDLITGEDYGQVFISDTNIKRIPAILDDMEKPYQCFEINQGAINNVYEKE